MKKIQMKKRRFITLVEMMIVMFLIAMITGVIAYNYTGSLEEGKAFKTKAGIEKIRTVMDLYIATHPGERNVDWKEVLKKSQLVKNPNDLMKDGWGNEYEVSLDHDGQLEIKSTKYDQYRASKGSLFDSDNKDDK